MWHEGLHLRPGTLVMRRGQHDQIAPPRNPEAMGDGIVLIENSVDGRGVDPGGDAPSDKKGDVPAGSATAPVGPFSKNDAANRGGRNPPHCADVAIPPIPRNA